MNLAKNNLVIVALAAVALYLLLSPRSATYSKARMIARKVAPPKKVGRY
jgi:hypothetical protein